MPVANSLLLAQIGSQNAPASQRASPPPTQYKNQSVANVSTLLAGVLNKWARSQPIHPTVVAGGFWAGAGGLGLTQCVGGMPVAIGVFPCLYRSTSATRWLYQFIKSEVTRLNVR